MPKDCQRKKLLEVSLTSFEIQVVGNKAKGRISKRVFQENKACQISLKLNISNPLIRARTRARTRVRIRG